MNPSRESVLLHLPCTAEPEEPVCMPASPLELLSQAYQLNALLDEPSGHYPVLIASGLEVLPSVSLTAVYRP